MSLARPFLGKLLVLGATLARIIPRKIKSITTEQFWRITRLCGLAT